MAGQQVTSEKDGATTGNTRVFWSEGCGYEWKVYACLGLTDVQLNNVSLSQVVCVDANLDFVYTIIKQAADKVPVVFTPRAVNSYIRLQEFDMDARAENGCYPSFLLLITDCADPLKVDSPYHFDEAILLEAARPASARQIGNNTFKGLDGKSIVPLDFQRSWLPKQTYVFRKNQYSLRGTVDGNDGGDPPVAGGDFVDSLAVLDAGTCKGGCVKCSGKGCTIILVHTESEFQISFASGVAGSWEFSGDPSPLGHANAFDRKFFRVETSNDTIFVSKDGENWTEVTADVALVAPTNVARLGLNNYIVGGSDGQFWRASGDGTKWVQVFPADTDAPDWLRICYDPTNERVWAIGTAADGLSTVIAYSESLGEQWTEVETDSPLPLDAAPQIHCMSHGIFFVIAGNLYKTVCDANGVEVEPEILPVVGASGYITGVGSCDSDCHRMWLTTTDSEDEEAKIFFSIDGAATWEKETLPVALKAKLTPSATINPIGCCKKVNGHQPLFAFGKSIAQVNL